LEEIDGGAVRAKVSKFGKCQLSAREKTYDRRNQENLCKVGHRGGVREKKARWGRKDSKKKRGGMGNSKRGENRTQMSVSHAAPVGPARNFSGRGSPC